MRSPLGTRWKVEGPNEQKVVSLLTSFRTPQQIADFDPDATGSEALIPSLPVEAGVER